MHSHRLAIAAATFCATLLAARHGLTAIVCVATALASAAALVTRPRIAATAFAPPIGLAVAGGLLLATLRPDAPAINSARTASYDGVVTACGEAGTDGLRTLTVRIGGLTLEAFAHVEAIPIGARIVVRGRIEPPDVARNPGEPSPRDLARERGVDGTLEHATLLATGEVDTRDATLWLPRLRAWAAERVRAHLDEPYASIATGALFGERGALPKELRDEFQETGTTHILVTAGLHLGAIAALAVALFELAGCGRIASSLAALPVLWLYAALSGGHLPAERAAAMATVALVARASGRRALSWNALGVAAVVVALLRPSSVESLSFALSFSCVAAIVLFAEPLHEALEALRLPAFAREAVALTIATQLGTWPLTAATFLTFAPYAPLANLLVVPVVAFVMALGVALVASAGVPLLAHACANAETTAIAWILGVVGAISTWPHARTIAIPPAPWSIVVYDLALAGAAVLLHHGRRVAALATVAAACAICAGSRAVPPGDLSVTVLDVGQADAIVIRTPAGHVFLVDAGGRLERGTAGDGDARAEAVGERIVVPYLLRQGIRHVDALLMTHPHGDHVAGAPPVIRDLDVAALADSGQPYPGHGYRETMRLAAQRSIPVLEPRGGDVWRTDDAVTFRFYAPTLPYITGSRSDINSNSLVFRLEYGSFRMLFTGDAGAETEARLLAARVDLRSEVLKVGHHGSAYGTTDAFVRAVAPRYAVISVGRHNLFGHPSLQTLDELERRGVHTLRTDENGAITVETDGGRYDTQTMITGESMRRR